MRLNINKIKEAGRLELLAKQMVEGFITGLHKSPYHGFSVEFAEHRLYNPGESTRHIDWKVFARTDKLFVKKFEEETNLRCVLVLDNSSSMHYPNQGASKIDISVTLAAALAFLLNRQRDAVGLACFSDKLDVHTEVKSSSTHLHKLFSVFNGMLEESEGKRNTAIAETLHRIATKIHKRSLVIIFSDMFDNEKNTDQIFAALQHLKHSQHEILIFHVTDKSTELDFEFSERPHRFIDIETGEKIDLNPSQIKREYQGAMKKFNEDLRIKCGQSKIDLVPVDINDDFDKVLGAYLAKRAKMS
ncbi:hypothetical protein FUAX_23040 [Fulvitalea axinellae]|uniref:DUF58 domain-containing protein n=1 Tax=Fulvitalea axinellae TaxID=1182444 RepID=A0AAU9CSD2_9BACT|nr:hypothetical protein FUAX_23040 [Fulvitalea axinellae]